MELYWQTSCPVSALHMAWVVASGRGLLDDAFSLQLQPLVGQIAAAAREATWSHSFFWRRLLTFSVDCPHPGQLAQQVLSHHPSQAEADRLAGPLAQALTACFQIAAERYPRMQEQLQLRVQPLQQAWEARGPGLMYQLRETTAGLAVAESASVILVQPAAGGDGLAHLATDRVHLEAVLTDIDPRLPETLRMAWLLSQISLDQTDWASRWALVPAILAAAEEVQLASLNSQTLALGLAHWLRLPADQLAQPSQMLLQWWQERSRHPSHPWSAAVLPLADSLRQLQLPNND
jgi:hypothetical protein